MAEKTSSKRSYWIVFLALMLLLALTVGLAFVPMHGLEAIPAYTIAIIKGLLVILFFMEVRHSSKLTWVFVAAGFLWLGIMLVLTNNDYVTRGWLRAAEPISTRSQPVIPAP